MQIEEEINEAERARWLRVLIAFYSIDLIICMMANFMHYFQGLNWLFTTEAILAAITLLFVFFVRKELKTVFSWESFTLPKALVYAIASIFFAIVVNIIIKWLNKNIFDTEEK